MRKILGSTLSLPLYLISAKLAFASTPLNACPTEGIGSIACKFDANSFSSIVGTFIEAVFVIAIVIALGYLIYGAIRWIMSQGDKSKVADARNHIIAAVIGLVIVFLSYFVINIIVGLFFPGTSLSNLQLPSLSLHQ